MTSLDMEPLPFFGSFATTEHVHVKAGKYVGLMKVYVPKLYTIYLHCGSEKLDP